MEIKINIGREPEGTSTLVVPNTYKRVSRKHATLIWNNGVVTIEDNESSNGTFVNGKRIAKTTIKQDDTVCLGGENLEGVYILDLKKIFESCRKAENLNKTDYSREFADVKQAYIEYKKEEAELKKNVTVQSQLPLRIVSFIPTLIGAVLAIFGDDPSMRITFISVGGVITGLINILMMGKGDNTNERLSEAITELQIKYQPRYCCPKCGMKYPLTTHWKKIEAEGKCLNHKCNAEFVKK